MHGQVFEHLDVLTLVLGNYKMMMFAAPLVPGKVRICFTVAQLSLPRGWSQPCSGSKSVPVAYFILTHLNENGQALLDAASGLALPQAEPGGTDAENKIPLWSWHHWLQPRLPRLSRCWVWTWRMLFEMG